MKGRQTRATGVLLGTTMGAIGMALWSRARSNQDDLSHMADELLLTLHDPAGNPLRHDSQSVDTLVQQASETVANRTGHRLRRIERTRLQGVAVPHLAVRTRIEGSSVRIKSPGNRHVIEAANAINGRIAANGLQHQGVQVSSAMPNWLVSSAVSVPPNGDGPACPAAPAPNNANNVDGLWPFVDLPPGGAWPQPDEPKQAQAGASDGATGDPLDSRIVVAVLDTWPGRDRLEEASARYPNNRLLQGLWSGVTSGLILDVPHLAPPDDVPEDLTHASADHGLFIMGIINSIAPHAELHLLHVLNENGHGRTDLILEGLDYCLDLAGKGRRVVVNLSLFLKIPNGASMGTLDEGIRRRISQLHDAGAVVVAAAGNDSLGRDTPLPPRAPASYPGALCVVATDRDRKVASYSNGPKDQGDSVATYGGQAVVSGPRAALPQGPDPRDGVIGAFAWPEVHPTGPNRTGWVYWSGTSFAAAVISGITANVMA
ncbi:MAG: S8/S53 family peptidase, partial [Chloroflexi bacterium]|nr:S8/S53 family peptidase [Chloroflexota bacterium]